MRCVGALLDNAQKLHAARRRDISIVHHNERPSDVIQYFTTLRHNRPAHLFFFAVYHSPASARMEYRRDESTACSYSEEINIDCFHKYILRCPVFAAIQFKNVLVIQYELKVIEVKKLNASYC